MLATTGGRMLVLGTPLDRSGLLFELWEGEIAEGWQKIHVPSTECPRIPASFLESEHRLLGEALYRREYLAEFAASATGMFDPDLLHAALLPEGFDFAPHVGSAGPADGVPQGSTAAFPKPGRRFDSSRARRSGQRRELGSNANPPKKPNISRPSRFTGLLSRAERIRHLVSRDYCISPAIVLAAALLGASHEEKKGPPFTNRSQWQVRTPCHRSVRWCQPYI
jgi:hypothetical protein